MANPQYQSTHEAGLGRGLANMQYLPAGAAVSLVNPRYEPTAPNGQPPVTVTLVKSKKMSRRKLAVAVGAVVALLAAFAVVLVS